MARSRTASGTGHTLRLLSGFAAAVPSVLVVGACSGKSESSAPPSPPASLAFTVEPSNASAGSPISPGVEVTIRDAFGNTVTSANTSITLAIGTDPAGGTLSGTLTIVANRGVATFSDLSINRVGLAYTLSATATNLSIGAATSSPFNVAPGPAAILVFSAQPNTVMVGSRFTSPVLVKVLDADSNSVASSVAPIALSIASNPGSATLGGAINVQASSGVATFSDVTLDKPGVNYTLAATSNGLRGATSAGFEVVAFASVSASGGNFGSTCAVSTRGVAYCWGNDVSGQLGDGQVYDATCGGRRCIRVPTAVSSVLKFTAISAGNGYTCGVATGGAAYCWGAAGNGVLGSGTFPPPICAEPYYDFSCSTTPVAVLGGLTFTSVSASEGFDNGVTCGLVTGGSAYCWGDNAAGGLGNVAAGDSSLVPVAVSGGLVFTNISVGHSVCAVTPAGATYCWGTTGYGITGADSSACSSSTYPQCVAQPALVPGGLALTAVSAADLNACGVTAGGAAYCWGAIDASTGVGATGTLYGATTPLLVVGGHSFNSISVGSTLDPHFCGVAAGGSAYCWGWDLAGELGQGSVVDSSVVPALVTGGLTFATVSSGSQFTCGITTAGALYCWGVNGDGQLGNGSVTNSATPIRVSNP